MKTIKIQPGVIYFLSCDYTEGASDYKGYVLSLKSKTVKRFNTGDPVVDWSDLGNFCRQHQISVVMSSSVDHFVMDSKGKYGWDADSNVINLKPNKSKLQKNKKNKKSVK